MFSGILQNLKQWGSRIKETGGNGIKTIGKEMTSLLAKKLKTQNPHTEEEDVIGGNEVPRQANPRRVTLESRMGVQQARMEGTDTTEERREEERDTNNRETV